MKSELINRKGEVEITPYRSKPGCLSRVRRFACLLSVAFVFGSLVFSTTELQAREREDLEVTLSARRVVKTATGLEELTDDPVAKPGDVIHYTAQFRNQSAKMLGQLAPTIPIPLGMEYIPVLSPGAPAEASLDGRIFESIPVRRLHLLADGRKTMVEVPISSYRALRWHTGNLAPGATFAVSARVRVTANPSQP